MKVLYNRYNALDEVAAGASFYYYEMSKLLSSADEDNIEFVPIDFRDVFSSDIVSKLTGEDVVIPNIGPYAWAYYYLREKKNLKFRIIHDVQTALFADHMLQEQLCGSMMRDGDCALFLSQYQKQMYMHMFPDSLNRSNTFVCNPLLNFMPEPGEKKENEENEGMTIGWVGRVFDAKNFGQALDIFTRAYKENRDTRMMVCGMADKKYAPNRVRSMLSMRGVNPDSYTHLNEGRFMSREKSFDALREMDVLLFPSVGNMESLGRVVVEANHIKTKVAAVQHGAMPEILPEKNLVDVEYNYDSYIDLNTNQSMGRLNPDKAANLIMDPEKLKQGDNSQYDGHDRKLMKIIRGEQKSEGAELHNSIKSFIKSVQIMLNADYRLKKRDALEKGISIIKESINDFDIVKTSLALRQALNYRPSAILRK